MELLMASGEIYEIEAPTTFQLVDDLMIASSEFAAEYGLTPQTAGRSAAQRIESTMGGSISLDENESAAVVSLLRRYGISPR